MGFFIYSPASFVNKHTDKTQALQTDWLPFVWEMSVKVLRVLFLVLHHISNIGQSVPYSVFSSCLLLITGIPYSIKYECLRSLSSQHTATLLLSLCCYEMMSHVSRETQPPKHQSKPVTGALLWNCDAFFSPHKAHDQKPTSVKNVFS